MVDIVVHGGSGIPEGAYISVRVGDVRRQTHFKPGSRFRFDSGAAAMRNFTLDVFEKVGSTQVGFGEFPAIGAAGRKEGSVEVARKDGGSSMTLDLELAPLDSCELEVPVQEPAETPQAFKSLRQQAASQARGYLQGHSVQRLLHSMVQSMLEEQPEDPVLFMSRYLEDVRSTTVSRATTAPAAPARSKPEELPPEVAGREEEASLRERPPPANAMVMAVEEDAAQAPEHFLSRGSPCEKQLASLAESPMEDRSFGAEDDEGFPVDTCPETLPDLQSHHSIAAAVLRDDPSVYQTLRNVRTAGGVSLARCIKPGMDVQGHPLLPTVGAVAGDADCYDAFAELFNPIIAELHCHEDVEGMRHPRDLELGKVFGVPIDHSGKHVVGVRIRANRNLSAMRMAPTLSLRDRREVERLLVGALVSLQGELAGSYHPLSGSESWRARGLMAEEEAWLRKMKLLFEEPDSDIAVASGLDRDWPDARGLFLSENRRFIAWVNEEDHVSFTALDPGGDLKKAFSLVRLAQHTLEDSLAAAGHSFAFSERLGFLGVTPAKLGTCLVVSAVLWIPKLGEENAALEALCQELGVRVRPILERGSLRGKHSCFEIFLQDLLGTSEVDQVNSVIEASRALVALEKRLQAGERIDLEDPLGALGRRRSLVEISLGKHDTPPPETVQADLAERGASAGRPGMVSSIKSFESVASSVGELPEELPDLRRLHSLLSDVLEKDPSLYSRLRDVRTRSGISLARCIKPGMDVRGHPLIKTVGVVAGDAECYEAFGEILEPVTVAAHPGWSPEASQPSSLDCTTVSSLQLHSSRAPVLRARVSVRRNLAGVRFPLACSPGERLEVDRVLRRATGQLAGALAGQYHALEGIAKELEKELAHEGLFLEEPDSILAVAAGTCRDWPEARGVFVSRSRELVAWINEEEHLRLWSTDGSGDLKAAFQRLCIAEGTLRAAVQQDGHSFARHPRLGYLTTCPGQLGTALRAEVRVQLPLVSAQPGFRAFCQRLGIRAVTANAPGGAWDVSNAETLGTGEAEQVNIVQEAVRLLVELDGRLQRGEQVDLGDVAVLGKGD